MATKMIFIKLLFAFSENIFPVETFSVMRKYFKDDEEEE